MYLNARTTRQYDGEVRQYDGEVRLYDGIPTLCYRFSRFVFLGFNSNGTPMFGPSNFYIIHFISNHSFCIQDML